MRPVAARTIRKQVAELNRVLADQNSGLRVAMVMDTLSAFGGGGRVDTGMCSDLMIEDDAVRSREWPMPEDAR